MKRVLLAALAAATLFSTSPLHARGIEIVQHFGPVTCTIKSPTLESFQPIGYSTYKFGRGDQLEATWRTVESGQAYLYTVTGYAVSSRTKLLPNRRAVTFRKAAGVINCKLPLAIAYRSLGNGKYLACIGKPSGTECYNGSFSIKRTLAVA